MKSVRRPLVALAAILVLVVIQAVADPTGLLALVGWSGALPQIDAVWTLAPYVVYLPVLLGIVWWSAVRAGDRFWTLAAGVVLAVMLAQAAACLVMTWDFSIAAWSAAYVTAKAVPAALIVAALTRWLGGKTQRERRAPGAIWLPAALFAAVAPLLAGLWWTSAVYAPGVPAARPDRGALSVIVAMVLIAGATALCLRWMRARVPGVLGGWLAALVAGGLVGIVQAIVAVVIDGIQGDIWPLMSAYVAVADGLSFGACVGWIVGVSAVLIDRVTSTRTTRVLQLAAGIIAVVAVGVTLITPTPGAAAAAADETLPAGFLRADGDVIADGNGNEVLLRGVNVNQLVDFYRPRPEVEDTRPLTDDDFAGIAAAGLQRRATGNLVVRARARTRQARRRLRRRHQEGGRPGEGPRPVYRARHAPGLLVERGHRGGHIVPPRHRHDVGLRRRSRVGDDHRRCTALPVPGARHLAGERPRVPELLLRHRRRPERAGRHVGEARRGVPRRARRRRLRPAERAQLRRDRARDDILPARPLLRPRDRRDPRRGRRADRLRGAQHPVVRARLRQRPDARVHERHEPRVLAAHVRRVDHDGPLARPAADRLAWSASSSSPSAWRTATACRCGRASTATGATTPTASSDSQPLRRPRRRSTSSAAPTGSGSRHAATPRAASATSPTRSCASTARPAPRRPRGTTCSRSWAVPIRGPRPECSPRSKPKARRLDLTGNADERSCGLEVWIPGTTEPDLETTGITDLETTEVPGGWIVTGCAEGDYALSANR